MKITFINKNTPPPPNTPKTSQNLNLDAIANMSFLRENGTFLINGEEEKHCLHCVNYAFSLSNGNMFKNYFDVIYQNKTSAFNHNP